MLIHQLDGYREIGLVLGPDGKSVALSPLIAGIAAGINRKTNHKSTYKFKKVGPEIDNLYTGTIAGDIGQSAMAKSIGRTKAIFGPAGMWDNPKCPLHHTVSPREHKTEATDAEIFGDLDGFILGDKLSRYHDPTSLKLSTLLTEYYSYQGLTLGNMTYSYNSREESFNIIATKSKLAKESLSFSTHTLLEMNGTFLGSTFRGTDNDELPNVMNKAVNEFYKKYIGTTSTGGKFRTRVHCDNNCNCTSFSSTIML